ncbi:MAG: Riboflavin transporter [Alphaproteobacteria bacterium MarineAlpha11_Bin1]|nr:MAG: Riboflavin transporter [Alphaproteobacteria bacterium MarineAlpha11_Bin1]|tara:strand:- start:6526 stop:7434 length:909 start_codon:yes stop_codon:yes gene_type:complete
MRISATYWALPEQTRAILLMTISAVAYALTFVTVRELSESFSVYMLVMLRAAIGTAFLLPWLYRSGVGVLRTSQTRLYGFRVVLVYTGNLCWFYALAKMALADATVLSFLIPVFTAIILAIWMREHLTLPRVFALTMGLAGAFIVIRPGFAEISLATIGMLYTTVAYGAATAATRVLTYKDDPSVVVFFMFALNLPLAIGPGIYHWTTPSFDDWALIGAFGLLSLYSQIYMTRALALAEAVVVMPTFYLQLPLAAMFGFLLFGQIPEIWLIPGAGLIIGGSYYSLWSEARKRRIAKEQAGSP